MNEPFLKLEWIWVNAPPVARIQLQEKSRRSSLETNIGDFCRNLYQSVVSLTFADLALIKPTIENKKDRDK